MNPSTTKNPAHGTVRRPSKEKLREKNVRKHYQAPMNTSTTTNPAHGTVRRPSKEKL
jgi:hypothetical protein